MSEARDIVPGVPGVSGAPAYRETLRTPWWWYPAGLAVASLLAAEFHIAGYPITAWLPFAVMLPFAVILVWWIGRGAVEVSGGEIRVRGAHLPLELCSGVVALDSRTLRRVVGREGDPSAFVAIRPWIGPGVQFWVDDADDPTPYWVISTRHPERLVAAVRARL